MSHLVELRDLVKVYPSPAGDFTALKGVDLQVDGGEFVAVIGKSGSGKSTLINAIAGIDRATSGEVHVAGAAVHALDENEIAAWRGRNLGVIFQFFQLLPTLTLMENVALPMEFAKRGSARARRERALALLERVEMGEHAHKLPSAVSGGQQQRVAIARALVNDPALIVADEPTGSLDTRTADTIFQLFEELVDQGKTILMVTHDTDLAARASRVVLIVDGEVVESHVRSALAGLSEDDLAEVSTRLDPVVLEAGEVVFRQGDIADRFYIVVRGSLEVIRTRSDGAASVVGTLGPGQYFGEAGLMERAARNATVQVTAGGGASLLALDADEFRHLVADNELTHGAIARVMRERVPAATVALAVPGAGLDEVAAQAETVHYQPGEIILRPGDPADRFCVVSSGAVDVLSASEDPELRFQAGRHFGTAGLSRDGRSLVTLRAAPDHPGGTRLVAIPAALHERIAADVGLTNDLVARLLRAAVAG